MLPPAPQPHKPKLLDQVRHAIRFKHYSLRTEQVYVDWIRRFILFHGKRHPDQMGAEEIREFLTDLATKGRVAASTQNQARKSFAHVPGQIMMSYALCLSDALD